MYLLLLAAGAVFLCLKIILDHLEYGFQGWRYDHAGYSDDLLPGNKNF
jgi:hypothetical protein